MASDRRSGAHVAPTGTKQTGTKPNGANATGAKPTDTKPPVPSPATPVAATRSSAQFQAMVRETLADVLAQRKAPPPAAALPPARRARWIRLTWVLAASVAAFVLFGPIQWRGWDPVPDVLVGNWTTSARQYADRGFVITQQTPALHVGRRLPNVYPIRGVRTQTDEVGTLYVLEYLVAGEPQDFSFYYTPGSG